MPRPTQYQSAAQKQAAYRTRQAQETIVLDRRVMENHEQRLLALQRAVWDAGERGDEFAKKCRDTQSETMLQRMIDAFNDRSIPTASETKRKENNR